MKKIKIPKRFTVEVGLWSNVGYPSGENVAQVGAENEYGTDLIPRRDFFGLYNEKLREETMKASIRITKKFNRGEDISSELDRLGIIGQNIIREAITDLRTPPNAPSTILKKGSSNPLIDSGVMRQSVTWKVKNE